MQVGQAALGPREHNARVARHNTPVWLATTQPCGISRGKDQPSVKEWNRRCTQRGQRRAVFICALCGGPSLQ
jgi:hypothetical protein